MSLSPLTHFPVGPDEPGGDLICSHYPFAFSRRQRGRIETKGDFSFFAPFFPSQAPGAFSL